MKKEITYTSSLSPDQVVPIQSDIYQNSLGVAVCTLDRTKSVRYFTLINKKKRK